MAGADDMRRARSTKAEPGFVKRRNRLNEGFSIRPIGMLASPAYRALSLSAFRVIGRIELELCSHGGNDNGQLPVTCEDFEKYGISHNQIAPAIREAEALSFIRVTEHGRGGNAEYRRPNKFYLTFPMHRGGAPTNEWQKIKSEEEATQLARAARENKNPQAVRLGQQRAKKTKNRPWNPVAAPTLESGSETENSPTPVSGSTASPRKQGLLSISRAGARVCPAPISSGQDFTGFRSLPLELRLTARGLPIPENFARAAARCGRRNRVAAATLVCEGSKEAKP
jgi:hypothetical protein